MYSRGHYFFVFKHTYFRNLPISFVSENTFLCFRSLHSCLVLQRRLVWTRWVCKSPFKAFCTDHTYILTTWAALCGQSFDESRVFMLHRMRNCLLNKIYWNALSLIPLLEVCGSHYYSNQFSHPLRDSTSFSTLPRLRIPLTEPNAYQIMSHVESVKFCSFMQVNW